MGDVIHVIDIISVSFVQTASQATSGQQSLHYQRSKEKLHLSPTDAFVWPSVVTVVSI
jgi:hypothetical protein